MIKYLIIAIVLVTIVFIFIKQKHKRIQSKIYKALVLVKVARPTKAQIERYYEWKKLMGDDYKLEILSDRSLKLSNITVNVISPQELFKKWPNILNTGGRCRNRNPGFKMWIIIVEHYVLCAMLSKIRFQYLWMVEQDFGYSGNLYEFMTQYENDEVDVISTVIWNKTNAFWPGCYTPQYYNWKIKYYNYKFQSYNWITRLSKNAVSKFYDEFELGRHVFNEEAVPERIGPLNLTNIVINSSFYGYKLSWNTRVKADEWNKILKDPKNKNKMFHALKF